MHIYIYTHTQGYTDIYNHTITVQQWRVDGNRDRVALEQREMSKGCDSWCSSRGKNLDPSTWWSEGGVCHITVDDNISNSNIINKSKQKQNMNNNINININLITNNNNNSMKKRMFDKASREE